MSQAEQWWRATSIVDSRFLVKEWDGEALSKGVVFVLWLEHREAVDISGGQRKSVVVGVWFVAVFSIAVGV